jgi:hypothetical protein
MQVKIVVEGDAGELILPCVIHNGGVRGCSQSNLRNVDSVPAALP